MPHIRGTSSGWPLVLLKYSHQIWVSGEFWHECQDVLLSNGLLAWLAHTFAHVPYHLQFPSICPCALPLTISFHLPMCLTYHLPFAHVPYHLPKLRRESAHARTLDGDFELKIMRMRGFSSQFLDNQPENRCTTYNFLPFAHVLTTSFLHLCHVTTVMEVSGHAWYVVADC